MTRLALFLFGLMVAATAAATLTVGSKRPGYCTLWEHRDMQGARFRMANGERASFARGETGSTAWRELPDWNDVVSSAKIDAGCKLQVWEHVRASGATKTWSGGSKGWNVNFVGSAWNDRVSSATCLCD